jgi:hypothetical protein
MKPHAPLKGHHYYLIRRLALSRATEMKRLTLRGFSDKSFKAHPKVKVSSVIPSYYDRLLSHYY